MRIGKKFYMAAASLVVAVGAFVAINATGSQAVSSFRNCNPDAIITCGAITEAELLQKYDQNVGDVQNIYKHYGITRDLLAGTASGVTIAHGTVYQDGRVVVGGKTVATGAYSVSRVRFTSAGTPRNVVINGKTYYEGPSMAIFTGPVDAFVFMKDGVFHKAVLSSCGNPLIATPPKPEPKPEFKCESLTAVKIDRTRFRFTATASAKNGANIAHYVFEFGDGNSKTQNSNVVEHTYAQPGTYTAKVKVNISVNGKREYVTDKKCEVTIKVEKEPSFKCDSLTAVKINRTTYRFTANATAENGANIAHYVFDFGDGSTPVTQNSNIVEHTYAQPGTYTATVKVNISVGGERQYVTSENCKVTIKVDEEPKVPAYKCESLAKSQLSRNRFRFTSTASASNGAEIVSYNYDFGDGTKLNNAASTVEHTYAQPGEYTATVTVNFRVNGQTKQDTGPNCKVKIVVEEEEKNPEYECVLLTKNKLSRTKFGFTAQARAINGAEIVSYNYNFGDGNQLNNAGSSVEHTYAEAGTYTATVTVNFRVNGQTKQDTGPNCKVTVTVDEEPQVPIYKCESLTARPVISKDRTFAFTLGYTAEGGASLTKVVYNFGDGTSETFTAANAVNVEHTYAQPGDYTITTTLYFAVPQAGQVVEKTDTCSESVTIKKDNCPLPGKEHLPKDSPECKVDNCPIPGKEHLPKDSSECKTDNCPVPGKEHLPKDSEECVPPELPPTGLETFISGGIGLGSITAAGYYFSASRRNLLNALLGR